MDFIRM